MSAFDPWFLSGIAIGLTFDVLMWLPLYPS